MKTTWLKKDNNDRLILIFAGWSSSVGMYSDVNVPGWDILLCHDFNDFDFEQSLVADYDTVYLYAWSLGVYAANRALQGVDITCAFAINGTESPCNNLLGIPCNIFSTTRERLDERNLRKFRRRMVDSVEKWQVLEPLFDANDNIEDLKQQLHIVETGKQDYPSILSWTRVYISEHDSIFPVENMKRAWSNHESKPEICVLNEGHWVQLKPIVKNTVPNLEKIAANFLGSVDTYNLNAKSQSLIADELTDLFKQYVKEKPHKVLEIGQGTGLYTQRFAPLTAVDAEIDLVDLYETPNPDCGRALKAHVADAEKWISESKEHWDVITSASAIQWFSNLRKFFADCSRCLNEKGVVVISTFAPGNLGEFDSLRPSPMLYATEENIRTWALESFSDVKIHTREIELVFPTAREALMHLRLTGVGGFASHRIPLSQLLAAIPCNSKGMYTLTYRPLFLVAYNR